MSDADDGAVDKIDAIAQAIAHADDEFEFYGAQREEALWAAEHLFLARLVELGFDVVERTL